MGGTKPPVECGGKVGGHFLAPVDLVNYSPGMWGISLIMGVGRLNAVG